MRRGELAAAGGWLDPPAPARPHAMSPTRQLDRPGPGAGPEGEWPRNSKGDMSLCLTWGRGQPLPTEPRANLGASAVPAVQWGPWRWAQGQPQSRTKRHGATRGRGGRCHPCPGECPRKPAIAWGRSGSRRKRLPSGRRPSVEEWARGGQSRWRPRAKPAQSTEQADAAGTGNTHGYPDLSDPLPNPGKGTMPPSQQDPCLLARAGHGPKPPTQIQTGGRESPFIFLAVFLPLMVDSPSWARKQGL